MNTPSPLTEKSVKDALRNSGNPATLTGLRVAATLPKRPGSWDLAVKDPDVVQWVAGLDKSEPTGDDPRAVTLAGLVKEGTPGAPDGVRPLLRGPMPGAKDMAAALVGLAVSAGHDGRGALTSKNGEDVVTGTPTRHSRVIALDLLGCAVMGHPARRGDCDAPGAVVVGVGGGHYHVTDTPPDPVPFIRADHVAAASALLYSFRPWTAGQMDRRGTRKRVNDDARTYIVVKPATEKTEAKPVAVKGYPLEDVVLAIVSARPGRELRKRFVPGLDEWVREHGIRELARKLRLAGRGAAAVKAAEDPAVAALFSFLLGQTEEDRGVDGKREKRAVKGHDRQVQGLRDIAAELNLPTAPAAPAVTPATPTRRRPGKGKGKGKGQGAA